MDAETGIGPVAHVGGLVAAEGHVADHQVEPLVGQGGFLERSNPHIDVASRVQRVQHATRQLVDLDGGDAAALGDGLWHRADEVADARSGLQDAAALETEALHGLPHRLDHMDLGVVAVVDRCARRLVVSGAH